MMFFPQVSSSLCKAFILSVLPLTLIAIIPTSAKAAKWKFDHIYAFGDSLSDNGNVYKATGNIFPLSPYYKGHFSNGPVWVEYLAKLLKLKLTDFAFGGATTGCDNTLNSILFPDVPPPLPGLQQEIDGFIANLKETNQSADRNALYIILAGANDYLPTTSNFTPYHTPNTPITNISSAVISLVAVGAKNIMVVNLPDLGELPQTNNQSQISSELNTLTGLHNSRLGQTMSNLSRILGPKIHLIVFDLNSLFKDAIANPTQFGLTNVKDSCLVSLVPLVVCDRPNEYIFWDEQHPTTAVDQIIAKAAYIKLSVTEPANK